MLEREMNIWDAPADAWIGITTNGTVRANGELVMGRGVAREARDRFPGLTRILGVWVSTIGNRLCVVRACGRWLFSFPVKHHWQEPADLSLIRTSARELANIATVAAGPSLFYLPRPGCGNGRLDWADVKPLLIDLPDNVIVVNRPAQPPKPTREVEMIHAQG